MNELVLTWVSYHTEKSEDDLKAYFDARIKVKGKHYWDGMPPCEITKDIEKFFREDQSVQK